LRGISHHALGDGLCRNGVGLASCAGDHCRNLGGSVGSHGRGGRNAGSNRFGGLDGSGEDGCKALLSAFTRALRLDARLARGCILDAACIGVEG